MSTRPTTLGRRPLLLAIAAALGLAAGPVLAQDAAPPLKVVATFSILGDIVKEIGGDRVAVTTLVGPDGDAHVFSPSPADGKALAGAGLVVTNGLGLEGWMSRLVRSSGTKAPVVVATRGVQTLKEDGHGHGHSHGGGGADPHAWQDVRNVKLYVATIRDALVKADPADKAVFETRAADYTRRLDALDAEIRAAVAAVPAERRRVITSHDAFRYFESAYGIDFVAPQGVSTESEASAADVARIIRQVRQEKIPAVFVENISDPRLAEQIAKETGARIGDKVYSDALSPAGGPAATYIDMMRHNVRAFGKALSS